MPRVAAPVRPRARQARHRAGVIRAGRSQGPGAGQGWARAAPTHTQGEGQGTPRGRHGVSHGYTLGDIGLGPVSGTCPGYLSHSFRTGLPTGLHPGPTPWLTPWVTPWGLLPTHSLHPGNRHLRSGYGHPYGLPY